MTNGTHSTSVVPINDVVFTDFEGGEGILVDLNTKQYYRLNETGALIWRSLEKGWKVEEIVSEMQKHYEVSSEQAQASIERLLRNLESNKLIKCD
jgi:Coenzyme PQQ synthesis protein D (PqqD)